MNKQEAIDSIMDHFNFQRAYDMMQCDDNYWIHMSKYDNEVHEVKTFTRKFMKATIREAENSTNKKAIMTTGGLRVECQLEGDVCWLSLEFVGESWSNYE